MPGTGCERAIADGSACLRPEPEALKHKCMVTAFSGLRNHAAV